MSLDQCINESYAVSDLIGHRNRTKKHYSEADKEKIAPIVFAELPQPSEKYGLRLCKTLLDSGASSSVVNSQVVQHLQCE